MRRLPHGLGAEEIGSLGLPAGDSIRGGAKNENCDGHASVGPTQGRRLQGGLQVYEVWASLPLGRNGGDCPK